MKTSKIKIGDTVYFKNTWNHGSSSYIVSKIFPYTENERVSMGVAAHLKRYKGKQVLMVKFRNHPSYQTAYPLSFLTTDNTHILIQEKLSKFSCVLKPKTTLKALLKAGLTARLNKRTGWCEVKTTKGWNSHLYQALTKEQLLSLK